MTYYLYHIPGKKIGVTRDLKYRVEKQQGYNEGEYDVILSTDDITLVSEAEISLQKVYGYKVDEVPYNKLKFNNMKMKINVTEQTTTFPCPVNKLKGQLMDSRGMTWETEYGSVMITTSSIKWIMENVKISMYNENRCYIYNKAFARWFDNNDAHKSHDVLGGNLADAHMRDYIGDQYNGKTRSGALAPNKKSKCGLATFDSIRSWANDRGLYDGGDPKTQALKLVEEVGETCRAILKEDAKGMIDGIGDCVVVLTNLAELIGTPIEKCINVAYNEIKDRTGKMNNGTFKKD